MNKFEQRVASLLNDDAKKTQPERTFKAVQAHLKVQNAQLEAKKQEDEQAVEAAKDAYEAAKYVTSFDKYSYLPNLLRAKKNVEEAEATLQQTTDSITLYTALLTEFATEDAAPVQA